MPATRDGKTWRSQFYYEDWQGIRHKKNKRGFKTKAEAEEWERNFRQQQRKDLDINFENFVEIYFADVENRLRESTIKNKRYVFDLKVTPYFKKKKMCEIKTSDIRAWQNELIKQGYAPTYLKSINNQLAALFNYAVRYYDLKDNPCRKAGSIGKSKADDMEFWTKQEFKQFLPSMDKKPEARMAFMLLYWTGMRIGELLALTYEDIDLEKRIISISKSYQRLDIIGSKRGLDTRVSLKSALAAEGFTGGTRGATEWNQWIAAEKRELAMVMERYGVKWLQKGTHEKHLSVLDFEKQERAKEVAELDSQKQEKTTEIAKLNQAVSTMKQELMTTTIKQVRAEEAVEKAREEGIVVQRDNETLSASNRQLRVENTSLEIKKVELRTDNRHLEQQQWQLRTDNSELEMKQSVLQSENQRLEQEQNKLHEDNEKLEQKQTSLQSDNQALKQMQDKLQKDNAQLEIQQEKLRSSIDKMVQSEKLLQRDVRKYDEKPEWQLPEPGAFASAKSFRDKVALPLVNKLKELAKSLTIQCVRLKEEVLQLRDKVKHLTSDVEFYKGKIRDMSAKTELLQEKADDLERVKRYAGAEQIDTIIGKVKEKELMEHQVRQNHRSYGAR